MITPDIISRHPSVLRHPGWEPLMLCYRFPTICISWERGRCALRANPKVITIIEDFGAQGLTTPDINERLISFSMILLSGGLCAREKQEVSARPQNAETKTNNFFVILWRHLDFHSSVKALFLLFHMKYRKREKTITTKCKELNFLFPYLLFGLYLTLDLKQSKKHLLQQSLYFQEGLPGILITI